AQQHCLVAAVALAGGAERAIELAQDARGRAELAVVRQPHREDARGAHRPDGVRAAGPDADLEEVEDRDSHVGLGWTAQGAAGSGRETLVLGQSEAARAQPEGERGPRPQGGDAAVVRLVPAGAAAG